MEPLLKRYGVQLYLAGHDHDLEHLRASDGAGRRELLHHVVTGAGSQTRGLAGAADSLFQHDQSGAQLSAPIQPHVPCTQRTLQDLLPLRPTGLLHQNVTTMVSQMNRLFQFFSNQRSYKNPFFNINAYMKTSISHMNTHIRICQFLHKRYSKNYSVKYEYWMSCALSTPCRN